ncbi:MAG: hypothetical protein PVH42_15760, partial [Desulfobacterales bacterium]
AKAAAFILLPSLDKSELENEDYTLKIHGCRSRPLKPLATMAASHRSVSVTSTQSIYPKLTAT